jgi:predicted acylesterase/phospholipase RssA
MRREGSESFRSVEGAVGGSEARATDPIGKARSGRNARAGAGREHAGDTVAAGRTPGRNERVTRGSGQAHGARGVPPRKARIGLALAGGGPLAGIYETGALLALSDVFEGVKLTELDVYVGVSAGSFFAASLANGVTPEELHRIFIENVGTPYPMPPELFLKPAYREIAHRLGQAPRFAMKGLRDWFRSPVANSPTEALGELAHAIPTGLCDPVPIERQLRRIFHSPGRTDDFRKLPCKLFLPVVDLDNAELRVMGSPGSDHVSISKSVVACAALPGMFPPVEIEGRDYVDGALVKTLHASIALDQGLDLLLCVNPIVPYDARLAAARGRTRFRRLREAGLSSVASQAFRTLIISRMRVGMARYATEYPGSDVVLFEAARDDGEMFFANLLRYAKRRSVCEHAYVSTIRDIVSRRATLEPILARHGIGLREDVIARAKPDMPALWAARNRPPEINELVRRISDLERRIRETA